MEKRILIPIDYTNVSRHVVELGDQWAQRTGAELLIFHGALQEDDAEKKLQRMIALLDLKTQNRMP